MADSHINAAMRHRSALLPIRGITLVELMIVVAIVAVLVAIAAPNLSAFFINNRLSAAANELVTALSSARSEAIRRGAVVTVRRCDVVSAALGCTEASSMSEWSRGWYMFVDTNEDGSRDTSAGSTEEVLRVGQRVAPPLTIFADGGVARDRISFGPDGQLRPQGANTPAIFAICYENKLAVGGQPRSRAILVNLQGRIRTANHDASGVPLNEGGNALNSSTGCTAPAYSS